MRFFTDGDQRFIDSLTAERDRLHARLGDMALRNFEVSKLNLELSREIVRLSQRAAPPVVEGEIEDPPTRSEVDRLAAKRPEQSQHPAAGEQ